MKVSKKKTHSEYIRRINLAIEYIAENLDKNIKLENVAAASYFSPFHFHRIFLGLVGETVNEFVSRKKMEYAVHTLLSRPDLSITEVASMNGFSSSANFAKAFKLYFGVSPSQLRNPQEVKNSKIGKIYSKYGKAFNVKDLYSQFDTDAVNFDKDKLEEMLMNVKIEQIQEKQIAYLTAPKGYDLDAIFETWDKIISWAIKQGITDETKKRFSICHDNPMITPVEKCRYDASIEINKTTVVSSPYTKSSIPAGKYAVAYFKGDSDKVSNFIMELYSAWMPTSSYEPDNYPPIIHNLNDSRIDGFVEMEIYIKLKELVSI